MNNARERDALPQSQETPGRLACLDAFRGFDILVMIFVNCIAGMRAVPLILRHAEATADTYTIPDLVFPGFLFIVGAAIPLSLSKRLLDGGIAGPVWGRIAVRTAGLLFLGILMVNEDRYSVADAGLGKEIWYLLAYLAVIALWNTYPPTALRWKRNAVLALRTGGAFLLAALGLIFRGRGADGSLVWLQPSWWGILGQIGWSYLICSAAYLLFGSRRAALIAVFGFLMALIILGVSAPLKALGPIAGALRLSPRIPCHAAIGMAGVFVGMLFVPQRKELSSRFRILFMLLFGLGLYAAGLLLRPLHGISKIRATESYALVSSGICCLLFLAFHILMDVLKVRRWASFLQPVGKNPLLAFLLPGIVDNLLRFASALFHVDAWSWIWPLGKQGGFPGMMNGVIVTGFIVLIVWMMTRAKIVLKL